MRLVWVSVAALVAAQVCASAAAPGGNTGPASAKWLRSAGYGVFMHFLPDNPASLSRVRDFDVNALANQLHEIGARYFVITLGQNSGYFNAPNATYDRITGYTAGERCSTRDLPMDLYKALRARGIRLMLYLPCQTPNGDRQAQAAFGLPQGQQDQPLDTAFAQKWATVIQEWSDRYGSRVSGWWFDGGYEHIHFNDAIADVYTKAVKHGNPHAIATYNPGVRVIRWTRTEDYTAGELNDPFDQIPATGAVDGSQWHALTFMGSHWGGRDTRFPSNQWAGWVQRVIHAGGAVTLDVGPNWDPAAGPIGSISAEQMTQLRAICVAVRGSGTKRAR